MTQKFKLIWSRILIVSIALILSSNSLFARVRNFETARLKSTAGAGVGSVLMDESTILNPAPIAFFNVSSVYVARIGTNITSDDPFVPACLRERPGGLEGLRRSQPCERRADVRLGPRWHSRRDPSLGAQRGQPRVPGRMNGPDFTRRAVTVALLSFLLFFGGERHAMAAVDAVVVDKSDRRLYLMTEGEVVAEYPVSFGGNPEGHKEQEGDDRTPEGHYTLDYKNPASAFFLSIHVSYPNIQDKVRARERSVDPGGNIMVHGQKNGLGWLWPIARFFDWTDGCIALRNGDMQKVWDAVEIPTPIEIRP